MSDPHDELDPATLDFYQQLRREYLTEAPARLGELRKDLAAIRAGEPDAADSLRSRFHRLAGSGGSYGFPAITEASREAEEWLAEHAAPDDTGFAYLAGVVGRVAAAFDDAARELGYPAAPKKSPPFGWRAYLVGEPADQALVEGLAVALTGAGYSVTQAPLELDPARIPASERPEIVVLLPGAEPGDLAAVITRWTAGVLGRHLGVALVARADAVDLLRQPYARIDLCVESADAESEVTGWAREHARAAQSPTGVLVVLGQRAEREEVNGWLEAAGLRTTSVPGAPEAAAALLAEVPDLLLLDWSLPEQHAEGLVRLLRRSRRHLGTPVVALGDQDSDPVRERALAAGVDELLIRPVTQARLVPAVLYRANRARRLHQAERRDVLTGFLTEGTLYDELESALAHARRFGEELSLLLLDVDHFRRVNEQLGHETGDRVLGHLARVIRERVRLSDFAARVGGEEFAVVFRTCTTSQAYAVAEKIRRAVEDSPPVVEGTPLPVRLSGGIAGFPGNASGVRELLQAAERALREAKETGRNRVVVRIRESGNRESKGY